MSNAPAARLCVAAAIACVLLPSPSFSAAQSQTLHAGIAETHEQIVAAQNLALGIITGHDTTSGGKKITTVLRGSSAWYQGLKEGDTIAFESVKESVNGLDGSIRFDRGGKTYQAQLHSFGDYHQYIGAAAPEATGSKASTPSQSKATLALASPPLTLPNPTATPDSALKSFNLNAAENTQELAKRTLQGHDLAVLIDRSGSMSTSDCPQALSRWDWCGQQTMQLSAQIKDLFPTGFTLTLFNNHQRTLEQASVDTIEKAFLENKPDGGTDTAAAILAQLKQHERQVLAGTSKPLVVVVITDGVPNDENALRKTLITMANESTQASDVSVVFLEVGEDNQATAFLEDLDRNLTSEGAKFHIVHSVIFEEVKQEGLLKALANALTSTDYR